MPLGQASGFSRADPGGRVTPRFRHRLIRFRHFIDGSLALASQPCLPGSCPDVSATLTTLEAELLSRRRFASQAEAKMACFSYIEGWYNPVRLHSGLGYHSPITYEADMQAAMTKT
jgi:transposase InsO family protein